MKKVWTAVLMFSVYAFSEFPVDSSSCVYERNFVKCSYDFEYYFFPLAEHECFVVAKNKVECGKGVLVDESTSTYKMQKDGSWIKKWYVKEDDESVVLVSKFHPIGKWPCWMKDVPEDSSVYERFKAYVGWYDGDSTAKELDVILNEQDGIPKDKCVESRDYIMKKISSGERFEMPYTLFPMENAGEKLSLMVCNSKDFVTTFTFNRKTGKREKMKEYGGLKPADYCKKFMNSNALYWKP